MPPQQGEVSLLTLFADVHYYISPPNQRPPHHRFDKGSYVYLYHNPIRRSGRIEIANHAGTPDQDAFAGELDTVRVDHTYKHSCLFTLTVDGFASQGGSPAHSPQQDASQWRLPTPDPMNQGRYMYRLHTLDIYFWTPEDANLFQDSIRRVMQPHQLQIARNPNATPVHAEYKDQAMSPVIARLESAAISQSTSPSMGGAQSFPGPPAAPAPIPSPSSGQPGYAPMAYNPAAPAAPEPIAHREKTPPPPDADDGTGLGTSAAQDHHAGQYGNPLHASFAPQSTSGPYKPGPPSGGQGFTGPPQQGPQRTNTSGSFPGPPQSPPSFAPPPSAPPLGQFDGNTPPPGVQRTSSIPNQQYANYPQSPGFPPAPQSPGFQQPQQYQPMASPPPGGYTQFQYGSTSGQVPGSNPHAAPQDVHQQLYRPSEHEASVKEHENPNAQAPNSNIGKRMDKVEKGVGRFLKKIDKKF